MTDTEETEYEEARCSLCDEPVEGRDKFSGDGETYLCQKCMDMAFAVLITKAVTNLGRK